MSMNLSNMPKLGFGLMRLPEKNGNINIEEACEMVDMYMKAGLNYFDTAYIYHGGLSEEVAKEAIVQRYPRDSFFLATKLPAWCMKKKEDRDRIFEEQLERTGVEYFDFYLLHSIEEGYNYEIYEKLNCFEWGLKKKKEGKIRHFGFSFHGSPKLLEKVLDDHPEIEFVQIQLNYLDWNHPYIQSGKLYQILKERNIPMVIMEPIKGGNLASLPPNLEEKLKNVRPNDSVASWALRYVASLPGVMTILSGMSSIEQMQDNIRTFINFEPLNNREKNVIDEITKIMLDKGQIECTACRYCCDGCPMNINIPEIFKIVNILKSYPVDHRPKAHYQKIAETSGKASACIACGQCEGVCPQHLPIVKLLKNAAELLEKE